MAFQLYSSILYKYTNTYKYQVDEYLKLKVIKWILTENYYL